MTDWLAALCPNLEPDDDAQLLTRLTLPSKSLRTMTRRSKAQPTWNRLLPTL